MPTEVAWDDAAGMALLLARDPSSHIHAAVHGWEYPMTREALALADLYDLQRQVATAPEHRAGLKPYPRPWPDATRNTLGDTSHLTVSEFNAAMASAFGYDPSTL